MGVRDEDIVEVGRPQLSGVSTRADPRPDRTVLYAPTWEGWTDDLFHTSIIDAWGRGSSACCSPTPPTSG